MFSLSHGKQTRYGVLKRHSPWLFIYRISQLHFVLGLSLFIGLSLAYWHYLGFWLPWHGFKPVISLNGLDPSRLMHMFVFNIAYLSQLIVLPQALFGMFVAPFKRYRRTRLARKVANARHPLKVLSKLSWEEFETLTAEVFSSQGYNVQETINGADGGVDVIAKRKGKVYLIQCKHWTSRVGVAVVREMAGIVATSKAQAGIIVATNGFSLDAQRFAAQSQVELIDGPTLIELLR